MIGRRILQFQVVPTQQDPVFRGQGQRREIGPHLISVTLWPKNLTATSSWLLVRSTVTDQTGSFKFNGLGPGYYYAAAWEDADSGVLTNSEFLARFTNEAVSLGLTERSNETPEFEVDSPWEDRARDGQDSVLGRCCCQEPANSLAFRSLKTLKRSDVSLSTFKAQAVTRWTQLSITSAPPGHLVPLQEGCSGGSNLFPRPLKFLKPLIRRLFRFWLCLELCRCVPPMPLDCIPHRLNLRMGVAASRGEVAVTGKICRPLR